MSVTLRKRKNSDGSTSLLLDIYSKGKRSYEFLTELKLRKASTADDREYNREMLRIAQRVQSKRMQDLAEGRAIIKSNISVVKWMEKFISSYEKSDRRNVEGSFGRFKGFLAARELVGLTMKDMSENIVEGFRDHLSKTCVGEGAHSYFARFKKMIKQAVREGVLEKNPCEGVRPPSGKARIKDVLTFDELQLLANTETQATQVKLAFLFSCLTGLRWVDVSILSWSNIDLRNNMIKLRQVKTGEDLAIQLNQTALAILSQLEQKEGLVFNLPSADGANKSLRLWVTRAGITKKITWHCARHSFGTNLLFHGADVYSASKLLGHSSLKHTQRYVRAADEMKQQAVNKLPEIKL